MARGAGTGRRAPSIFPLGVRFMVAPCSVSTILQRAVNVPKARCHHDAKREINQNIRQIREHQRRPPLAVQMFPHAPDPSVPATKRRAKEGEAATTAKSGSGTISPQPSRELRGDHGRPKSDDHGHLQGAS